MRKAGKEKKIYYITNLSEIENWPWAKRQLRIHFIYIFFEIFVET